MSQLSEYRRKVLKKSQEALSAELGYEKWQTYAAQENGRNPLPEEVKKKLRGKKYDYTGPWPDQEAQEAAGAGSMPSGLAREVVKLEGRLEGLERAFERLAEAVRELAIRDEERRKAGS
jgi:hypothetical protein